MSEELTEALMVMACYNELNNAKDEIARLTQRVRELEDALQKYADHKKWNGINHLYETRTVYFCAKYGWKDAEDALKGSER